MRQLVSFLARALSAVLRLWFVVLLLAIAVSGAWQLKKVSQPASFGTTTPGEIEVKISIPKTQLTGEGQELTGDQLIQLSVYVPDENGNGLAQKANLYAEVVDRDEDSVIVSVPVSQAMNLQEALITENAKVTYYELDKRPEPTSESPKQETISIPEPEPNAVQLKLPVEEIQGGIISLDADMTVRLVIIERLGIYHVQSDPAATLEPTLAVEACAEIDGFMVEGQNNLINKEGTTPTYILLEIPAGQASEIARALTHSSAVYLLPITNCE